jgi:hypothetical protein
VSIPVESAGSEVKRASVSPHGLGPIRRWVDFWFEPASPVDLGAFRALYFGLSFLYFASWDFSGWGDLPDWYYRPTPLFRLLGLPVLSSGAIWALQTAWKVSLLTSALGLATRVSTLTCAALSFYLIGLNQCFGKTHHAAALSFLTIAILSLSRCGDSCSIDAWIKRRMSGSEPKASGEYGWPLRMVWLAMSLIFLNAGISKLRHSGLAWVTTDNMSLNLIEFAIPGLGRPYSSYGPELGRYVPLTQLMAASTLVVELLFPLAMISRRARLALVPSMFLMQVGITLFMGRSFVPFMFSYLAWVPWSRLVHRRRAQDWRVA